MKANTLTFKPTFSEMILKATLPLWKKVERIHNGSHYVEIQNFLRKGKVSPDDRRRPPMLQPSSSC